MHNFPFTNAKEMANTILQNLIKLFSDINEVLLMNSDEVIQWNLFIYWDESQDLRIPLHYDPIGCYDYRIIQISRNK